jgi:hypothetical protein
MPSSPRAFSPPLLMRVQFNFVAVENHFSGRKKKKKTESIAMKTERR